MKITVFALAMILAGFSGHAANGINDVQKTNSKVLIVPLNENVASNYYPLSMMAEELNIGVDSVVFVLNQMVAESISESNSLFINAFNCKSKATLDKIQQQIKLEEVSSEIKTSDLSAVSDDDYKNLIDQTEVGYVVFINGYYITKKEKPFNTIFHTISFSVFDSKKKKVMDSSNFYNTFDLISFSEIKNASKKCTLKMTQAIIKKANKI